MARSIRRASLTLKVTIRMGPVAAGVATEQRVLARERGAGGLEQVGGAGAAGHQQGREQRSKEGVAHHPKISASGPLPGRR